MIKGSLKDVSLAGILQFLSIEANKSYRMKVERGSLHGEVIVVNGDVVSAAYGLLRGEDALCEFMTWEDGGFWIERVWPRHEDTFERNLNLRLQQGLSFADQASYLLENNIGLNTVIISSKMFGTPEWQESSKLHPLQREDFLILGWLSQGRTMRQAMRDFAFDLLQATSILYRLVLTRSVDVVRAGALADELSEEDIVASVPLAPAPMPPPKAPPVNVPPVVVAVGSSLPSAPQSAAAPPSPPSESAIQVPPAVPPREEPASAQSAVQEELRKSDPNLTMRRTTVLPIISIDIERLMKATFSISQFGFLALKNPALDDSIRSALLKVESGKTLEAVVEEGTRPPSGVLSTYRYCLERGYITNPDSVLPLTADLLLRRTELDQYLLQRRRVTSEVLRDLTEEARVGGIPLSDMLVKTGFLSQEDLDTVTNEQLRFALR
jgi:hypothetical protein